MAGWLGRRRATWRAVQSMVAVMVVMMAATTTTGVAAETVERSGRAKRSEALEVQWSVWFNSDRPWSGEGDFETTENIEKKHGICSWDKEVVGAQCRVSGTNDTFDSSTTAFLEDHLLQACSSHGLICLNSQQPSGRCHDYQVRFLCQDSQSDDSGRGSLFPNLDFKLYILIAAVPLVVVALRLLWTCCLKPRLLKRRQRRQGRRRGSGDSASTDGEEGLSPSSSQASIDSSLANPPPAYAELFGEGQPPPPHAPRPVVFSISGAGGGECCAGCGKRLRSAAPRRVSLTLGGPEGVEVGEGRSPPALLLPPPLAAAGSPSRDGVASVTDDVFISPPSSSSSSSSQTAQTPAEPGLRPSLPSSGSLQGAVAASSSSSPSPAAAPPLAPPPFPAAASSPPPAQPPTCCTCSCHRLVPAGHVNLAFAWDCGQDAVDASASAPPALPPGMHKPALGFPRIESFTSFTSYTSLPDYEEALEILKKNGLFVDMGEEQV